MGSQAIQGHLWGQRPQDWANIQEPTGNAGYLYVLDLPEVKAAKKLLDVGCGSGLFSRLAHQTGIEVTGLDASEQMVEQAKQRDPGVTFLSGEMEALPFEDRAFDVVCGFNSFQYAANVKNALSEAKRVLKNKGLITVMIWGNKEDCEAATYLKAIGSLLPPPPPGAPGPFALTENGLLETLLTEVGFTVISSADIPSIWDYANKETALKGLLSAGPAARAIDHSGFERAYETVSAAMQPYIQPDGRVIYHNKYRIVVAEQ